MKLEISTIIFYMITVIKAVNSQCSKDNICNRMDINRCEWRSQKDLNDIKNCCPYSGGYEELATNTYGTCCCPYSRTSEMRIENINNCLYINPNCKFINIKQKECYINGRKPYIINN